VYWNARLMIMDEPTAALGVPEQRKVLQLVRALREAGVPVILVTHNMQDAFAVADRLLVMRRGRLVGECSPSTTSVSELVSLMLGATEARV
jgi:ABC-type sugar transport system ATPase subunit